MRTSAWTCWGCRLDVKYTDETVYLTGDCEKKIYEGVVEI